MKNENENFPADSFSSDYRLPFDLVPKTLKSSLRNTTPGPDRDLCRIKWLNKFLNYLRNNAD